MAVVRSHRLVFTLSWTPITRLILRSEGSSSQAHDGISWPPVIRPMPVLLWVWAGFHCVTFCVTSAVENGRYRPVSVQFL